MKRAFVTGMVLAWICGPWTWAQSLDWKEFNSTELGFSVRFPGTPQSDPPQFDKRSDGSVKATTTIFTSVLPNVISMFGVTDYTFSFNVDEELTLDQTNFLKAINGTLVTSRRAEYINGTTKLPELIFTFEFPKLDYTGRAIVISQGRRIYMAVFASKKGMDFSAATDIFLDSVELTGTPPAS